VSGTTNRPEREAESAIRVAAATDVGLKRSHNEDHHAVRVPEGDGTRAGQVLLVVSDGMGGSLAGEVASELTVDTVVERYAADGDEDPGDSLRRALESANQLVHERNTTDPSLSGMGATCTAAVITGAQAWVAHVGDSRAYLIRDGRIRRLTHDHSLVAQLVERNELDPDSARVDPRRNVVTRCIGYADTVEVDVTREAGLARGDTILLCSDGLHGQMPDEEIAEVSSQDDLERACEELIRIANDRGGPDNITVVLARLESRAAAAAPERRARSGRLTLMIVVLITLLAVVLGAVLWTVLTMRHTSDRVEAGPQPTIEARVR
jgi:protein phosphatase